MVNMIKKYAALIIVALVVVSVPAFNDAEKDTAPRDYTHTVLVEVGTATWCSACPASNTAWHSIYSGGNYDFEYCEMVVDKNSVASTHMNGDYNLYWVPTSYWDGGYHVYPGTNQGTFVSYLNSAGARTVADLDATLNVGWLGGAQVGVSLSVTNNEATTYTGHLRVYILELESTLWNDHDGNPYYHAFLDFVFDYDLSIPTGGTHVNSTVWNGAAAGYPGITSDNIQVILAVFDDTPHQAYSDPNDANGDGNYEPFWAYYVDETVAAFPSSEFNPPEISGVQATPSVQIQHGYVNITATVTDDSGVGAVNAVITTPDRGVVNQTMSNIAGTDTYYYNTTYGTVGTHSFFIWASDINGNTNVSTPQTFQILLQQNFSLFTGWNLITIPVQNSYTASSLAALIPGCTMIAHWNASTGSYSTFIVGVTPPGSQWDFAIEDGISYYVKVTGDTSFTVSGVPLENVSITLYPGWNTIGWWHTSPTNASSLGGAIASCTMLAQWNAATSSYTTFLVGITPPGSPWDFTVDCGMGVFVKVTSGSVWNGEG